MFNIMDKRINEKKKTKELENEIKSSVPIIDTALHTSVDIDASNTRAAIVRGKEELIEWLLKNPEKIKQNRALFNMILKKYRSISNKIEHLL